MKPTRRDVPSYPREMAREGWQADVYAINVVLPTGRVERVVAKGYTGAQSARHFENATRLALENWEYEPFPDREGTRRVCVQVDYRLKN